MQNDSTFGMMQLEPNYQEIVRYLKQIKAQKGGRVEFVCGYEAGCLGYSLYHELKSQGINCIILAPSTMPVAPGDRVKTDRRDAMRIAKCLAYNTYSPVYVPTEQDDAI
jgi:transposase